MNNRSQLTCARRVRQFRHGIFISWSVSLLLLLLPAAVQAQFSYWTNNGTITITGYMGPGGAVTIPSTIDGLPVTRIGQVAFWFCYNLLTVTIPNTVTSIGPAAFVYCTNLTDVTIPSSVTSIEQESFEFCSRLPRIVIPSSITNIGRGAFWSCSSLVDITVDPANIVYSSANGVLFDKSQTTLVQYPPGKTGSYSIPSGVNTVNFEAFAVCANLTSVTVPNSVTNIGHLAFLGSPNLTAITVNALNSVYSSVDGVLFNKAQTTLIECPQGKAGTYQIPGGVTNIADQAFLDCTNLTSVVIPNGVTSIEDGAFNDCTAMAYVSIPDSVTSIGKSAFSFCLSLTNVTTIADSVTYLGDGAFQYCGLTSIKIGNGITTIGNSTFGMCSSLTSVTIPNSVKRIGQDAFNSSRLVTVTIPGSVTNIGDHAFYWCADLTAIVFGGNAPALGGDAVFEGDTNATVYYLPGTTGWSTTYGGRPTALWRPPTIQRSSQTQTAEAGSAADFRIQTSGLVMFCLWFFNDTNLVASSKNCQLELTNLQFSQSGFYTAVITNAAGAVTSSPALLQVIAPVQRRPVPRIEVIGAAGSLVNVDYAGSLILRPNWTTLSSVNLTSASEYYFDLITPLPPQRFYRAWQVGAPDVIPSLDLHIVPAITLTGNLGDSFRLDYINRFGPTDAWVTLDTVTLTNTSQLYFDTSAIAQPPRLWRIVPVQ